MPFYLLGIQRLHTPWPVRDAVEVANFPETRSLLLVRDFAGQIWARTGGSGHSMDWARLRAGEAESMLASLRTGTGYYLPPRAGSHGLAVHNGMVATGRSIRIDRDGLHVDTLESLARVGSGSAAMRAIRTFLDAETSARIETRRWFGIDYGNLEIAQPGGDPHTVWLRAGSGTWCRFRLNTLSELFTDAARASPTGSVNYCTAGMDGDEIHIGSGRVSVPSCLGSVMPGRGQLREAAQQLREWLNPATAAEPTRTDPWPEHAVGDDHHYTGGRCPGFPSARRLLLLACESHTGKPVWVAAVFFGPQEMVRFHLAPVGRGSRYASREMDLIGEQATQVGLALAGQQVFDGARMRIARGGLRWRIGEQWIARLTERQRDVLAATIEQEQQHALENRLPQPADCATLAPEDT